MLWFLALLSFSVSLATKCVSLNNDPCTIRLTLIGLHPVELSYCPFMFSSDTFSGICNPVDDLSVKAFVPGKIKDINVKAFNILTSKNKAKTMVKHISCYCKSKFNSATSNSHQKWSCELSCVVSEKKSIVGILTHVFVRMVSI